MTRSLYVLGGAGSGKSTFTGALLHELGTLGPQEDLYALRNAKAVVTLRGHWVGTRGLYLGCMRDVFPGTDGLDRASSPVGEAWLYEGGLPRFILAEGATLSTKRFLTALHDTTDLLVVHLYAPDDVKRERFARRGTTQAESFVTATTTRAANRAAEMADLGTAVLTVDSSDPCAWDLALDLAETHLRKP